LRDYHDKPSLLSLLEDFNIRLAEQSSKLIHYRAAFAKSLAIRAAEIHNEFSNFTEELSILYKTINDIPAADMSIEDIYHEALSHQQDKYQAELRSGLCLSGCHKDDLIIEINGIGARKFASQGQARTASISIKLAERDIHFNNNGEYPVLLLDDVLSELDSGRRSYVLGKITNGQVFITCCDDDVMSDAKSNKLIQVENGKLL
jgi:DNA replication and repair protein RecF